MPEERRVVTVLFSDVAGSTALAESSDPEDVRALLGRYYAIAREVIAAHGGTVEKFIGDSVMAVFGIPRAHGDDAERALAAALALRGAVAADAQTSPLSLRIGTRLGLPGDGYSVVFAKPGVGYSACILKHKDGVITSGTFEDRSN